MRLLVVGVAMAGLWMSVWTAVSVKQVLHDMERVERSPCVPGVIKPLEMHFNASEWTPAAEIAVRISNFLTQVYTADDPLSDHQLMSLVTSSLGGVNFILGSWIDFEPFVHRNVSNLAPYATQLDGVVHQTLATDDSYYSPATELHNSLRNRSWNQLCFQRHRIESRSDDGVEGTYVAYPTLSVLDGNWTIPYFDCGGGNKWMVSYLAPFFQRRGGKNEFIGATGIDIDITVIDIDQCDEDTESDAAVNDTKLVNVFHGSHRCHASTVCTFVKGQGFVRGAYHCRCREGFYFPNSSDPRQVFDGRDMERYFDSFAQSEEGVEQESWHPFQCLRCEEGCETCSDATPCMFASNVLLRSFVLVIACGLEMALVALMSAVWFYREKPSVRSGSPVFLSIMCAGAMLMVAMVLLRYFTPSTVLCQTALWFNTLGFTLLFGALLLRMWRINILCRVSSAKTIRISDHDLLHRMAVLLLSSTAYMITWTVAAPEQTAFSATRWQRRFLECSDSWWHLTWHVAEVGMLLCSVYLCFRVRRVPSAYNESRYVTWAIYNSMLTGNFLLVASHFFARQEGPDVVYVTEAVRILVVAVGTVGVIIVPKISAAFHAERRASSQSAVVLLKRNSPAGLAAQLDPMAAEPPGRAVVGLTDPLTRQQAPMPLRVSPNEP